MLLSSLYHHVNERKMKIVYLSIFLLALVLFQAPNLEASGWGKNEQIYELEENVWNEVYFDMNGLNLTAWVPNYNGARLQNGMVSISGVAENNFGYVITTTYNTGFSPPKTLKEFVKLIQNANPEFTVVTANAKLFGAKYAVDLIPRNQEDAVYWRFLSTNDRLIRMGTDDTNNYRISNFFDSIHIK